MVKRVILAALIFLLGYAGRAEAWLTDEQLDGLTYLISRAESSGRTNAIGPDGERGLCQIKRETWQAFSDYPYWDAFDGAKNFQVCRAILEALNNHYGVDSTPGKIILSYNTGRFYPKGVPKWALHHPNNIYRAILKGDSEWALSHGIKGAHGPKKKEKN